MIFAQTGNRREILGFISAALSAIGALCWKVPVTFRARKCFSVCAFKIKVSIIFSIRLSVKEAKLNVLWASDCVTIQRVLILKFAFWPEKFPGLSRNGPQKRLISGGTRPGKKRGLISRTAAVNRAWIFPLLRQFLVKLSLFCFLSSDWHQPSTLGS